MFPLGAEWEAGRLGGCVHDLHHSLLLFWIPCCFSPCKLSKAQTHCLHVIPLHIFPLTSYALASGRSSLNLFTHSVPGEVGAD